MLHNIVQMPKNNFDFLRFLLAFIVVLAHITELSQHPDYLGIKPLFDSHLSVTGFFIISGFLISASYVKNQHLTSYFIKRVKRLLPAYLTIILVGTILLCPLSSLSFIGYFTSPLLYKYLLSNLTFMNFIQPCLPGVFENNVLCAVNGALWTIKVEVSFYIVLPILLFYLLSAKQKWKGLVGLYLFGLVYQYGLGYASQHNAEHEKILSTLQHQLPGFFTYFSAGIGLYLYFDTFIKWKNKLILIALPVFVIEYYLHTEILLPLALGIILMYIAFSFPKLNNWGKYGDISYGIYIYHFPLIQTFVSLGFFQKYNPFALMGVIIALVLLLAFLSWNVLEKRFLKR